MVAEAGTPESTGAAFDSRTVIVIGADVVTTPSLAPTENVYTPGPWASVGVQVKTPLDAPDAAPDGAPESENARIWDGTSSSLAVAVNVYGVCSRMDALAGTLAITGAALTSLTVSEIAASVLATPSLTRTVNG